MLFPLARSSTCLRCSVVRNVYAAGSLYRRGFAVLSHTWRRSDLVAGQKQRVVLMLHGILGSKSNWNMPAKRLFQHVGPLGWQVLQLDHRAHGQSPHGDPPHTLEACAQDLCDTLHAVGVSPDAELVVCGHSFGGKVALAFLDARLRAGSLPPRMTWLFDSVLGSPIEYDGEQDQQEQTPRFVLGAIREAAGHGVYVDRAALIEALQLEHGLHKPVAQWVAQSVRTVPGGIELSFDVEVLYALYSAYCSTDMWDLVAEGRADIGVVIAGRNRHSWGLTNLRRLRRCGKRVKVVTLEGAGHNVHVDDLPGLLRALEPTFT